MILTPTQLNYLLMCYGIVFSVFGLYFFARASKILKENQELINNFFEAFEFSREGIDNKQEGTDAD